MKNFSILLLFIFQLTLNAQIPTWSSDVASIVYSKCTSCHRTGGIAPFTLESYDETVRKQSSINREVSSEIMPPWPPDNTYARYAHERSLSPEQKAKILSWISSGMLRGDASKEPSLPLFAKNGDLTGTPDLVLNAPLFNIKAPSDIYQCFVIKNPNTVDKFIKALECIPGNRNAVHHVLIYYDKTGEARKLDNATTEPGYVSFGGIGVNSAELIGAWVPGSTPQEYPKGMGVSLPANGDIILQVHYPSSADGQMDQTMLKIYYSNESKPRQIMISPILNHTLSLLNGPLIIPANTIKTFNAAYTIPNQKITLLGVAPHMHLIGKSIEVYAEKPTKEVQNLIRITDWNFHWQGSYYFPKPVILTQGTKLLSKAIYDNTSNNPNNPNSPPKLVSLGEKTTDEMMLVYFTYLVYQNGDENIVIDSSALLDTKNISVSNSNELKLTRKGINQFTVEIEDKWLDGILNVYNVDGKSMLRRKINNNLTELTLSNNIAGIVFFQLEKNYQTILKKVFVD